MSYYDTIEWDVKRAREIAKTHYVLDAPVAAGKLLASLADEVERLQEVERKLGLAATALGQQWKDAAAEVERLQKEVAHLTDTKPPADQAQCPNCHSPAVVVRKGKLHCHSCHMDSVLRP